MWAILVALAEPLSSAFASAVGRMLLDVFAQIGRDQAVADAATSAQALAASEAARAAERAMTDVAVDVSDAELLAKLDGGAA